MNRSLLRRLEALEGKLGGDITLFMPGGGTRKISSRRLVSMLGEAGNGVMRDDARAVLESIADDADAKGQGRLTEVVKVMWQAHVDAAQQAAQAVEQIN